MASNVIKRQFAVQPADEAKEVMPSGVPVPPGPPGPPGKDAPKPRGFSFAIIRDDMGAIVEIVATPL